MKKETENRLLREKQYIKSICLIGSISRTDYLPAATEKPEILPTIHIYK